MTTIADIVRTKTLLDNSEWFEGQDADGSFKSDIFAIRQTPIVNVTTGASTTNIDAYPQVVMVTSGGSGGNEVLNIPNPTLDVADSVNVQYIGERVTVVLLHQTNPSDTLVVTCAGSAPQTAPTPAGRVISHANNIQAAAPGVILDYEGACASFVWCADTWRWDFTSTDGQTDTTQANVSIDWRGFAVQLKSENGYITLDPHNGQMSIFNLPTSDPHVPTALWNNNGVLSISAGP